MGSGTDKHFQLCCYFFSPHIHQSRLSPECVLGNKYFIFCSKFLKDFVPTKPQHVSLLAFLATNIQMKDMSWLHPILKLVWCRRCIAWKKWRHLTPLLDASIELMLVTRWHMSAAIIPCIDRQCWKFIWIKISQPLWLPWSIIGSFYSRVISSLTFHAFIGWSVGEGWKAAERPLVWFPD